MHRLPIRIAAILSFVIGVMSIVAGGAVLRGRDPGYHVIAWLPAYNFAVGLVSAVVTAALIWRQSRAALAAALATFAGHTLVMVILQTAYRDVVARQSLMAMTFRMAVWLLILLLVLAQGRRERRPASD